MFEFSEVLVVKVLFVYLIKIKLKTNTIILHEGLNFTVFKTMEFQGHNYEVI